MRNLIKNKQIIDYINLFKINTLDTNSLQAIHYEFCSPDSFILCARSLNENYYVLYATDCVCSLDEVKKEIEKKYKTKVEFFLESLKPPKKVNSFYLDKPKEWDDLARYASEDAIDYIFLAKINKPIINDYFNGKE